MPKHTAFVSAIESTFHHAYCIAQHAALLSTVGHALGSPFPTAIESAFCDSKCSAVSPTIRATLEFSKSAAFLTAIITAIDSTIEHTEHAAEYPTNQSAK